MGHLFSRGKDCRRNDDLWAVTISERFTNGKAPMSITPEFQAEPNYDR